MDNQHRKIAGYRELSSSEIEQMNEVKLMAFEVGELLDSLAASDIDADGRWLAIARTQLQQGFMAATRAIAKPDFF